MSTMQPKFYTSKDKQWAAADGNTVPFSRVTKAEKAAEKYAEQLHKQAVAINAGLAAFNEKVKTICTQLYEEAMAAANADGKKGKGNFTWYNFDKSFKVQVDMQDRVEYDDIKLQAAKQMFDEYISKHVAGSDELIVCLINDAFTNTKGKVDSKKIQTLISYKNRFKGDKYALWHQGCDLLISAATITSSKRYTRFFVRQDDGSYQNIELNFSSI